MLKPPDKLCGRDAERGVRNALYASRLAAQQSLSSGRCHLAVLEDVQACWTTRMRGVVAWGRASSIGGTRQAEGVAGRWRL